MNVELGPSKNAEHNCENTSTIGCGVTTFSTYHIWEVHPSRQDSPERHYRKDLIHNRYHHHT